MAKPTKKNEEIENFIDQFTPNSKGRRGSITQNVCVWCGKPATEFRDKLSAKEYTISGFCQDCQDKTFGV